MIICSAILSTLTQRIIVVAVIIITATIFTQERRNKGMEGVAAEANVAVSTINTYAHATSGGVTETLAATGEDGTDGMTNDTALLILDADQLFLDVDQLLQIKYCKPAAVSQLR